MLLIHVTTVPITFNFFRGQISYMLNHGFAVHGVSSAGNGELTEVAARENIPVHPIAMARSINLLADLMALTKLYRLFRKLGPAIVHAHTPKGGLLGVLAARMARVPVVIYEMHGLPFSTAQGLKRRLLRWSEFISCRTADRVIAVSFSIRQRALAEGFCPEEKIQVLAHGSANGVDAMVRFNPAKVTPRILGETKRTYRIPKGALVLGFVGRIVRDKGIIELAEAWNILRSRFPSLHLILVGMTEPQDPVPPEILAQLAADYRVRFTGHVDEPVNLYALMDILILPTYREGFPVSVLEAAAMQVPVVTTRVDGCIEAVIDGVTGLIVPPQNAPELAQAILHLIANPAVRRQMGAASRRWVLRNFRPELICYELYRYYIELLKHNKIKPYN